MYLVSTGMMPDLYLIRFRLTSTSVRRYLGKTKSTLGQRHAHRSDGQLHSRAHQKNSAKDQSTPGDFLHLLPGMLTCVNPQTALS